MGYISCIHCNGKGRIYFGSFGKGGYRKGRGVKCKTCNGRGTILVKETEKVVGEIR